MIDYGVNQFNRPSQPRDKRRSGPLMLPNKTAQASTAGETCQGDQKPGFAQDKSLHHNYWEHLPYCVPLTHLSPATRRIE